MDSDSPIEPAQPKPYLSYKYVLPVAALILLFTFVGMSTFLMSMLVVFAVTFLLRNQLHKTAIVVLVCTPFVFCFLWGTRDYLSGTAELQYSGLPDIQLSSMDPDWRCMRSNGWTFTLGAEKVFQLCYNSGIRTMTQLFGYMPGTYKGPYPTQSEATEALENGVMVDVNRLLEDQIELEGETIELDRSVGADLLDKLYPFNRFKQESPEVTAALWQEECLILRFPLEVIGPDHYSLGAAIVLISTKAGRPFAYYGENGYNHGFPPVEWRRDRS